MSLPALREKSSTATQRMGGGAGTFASGCRRNVGHALARSLALSSKFSKSILLCQFRQRDNSYTITTFERQSKVEDSASDLCLAKPQSHAQSTDTNRSNSDCLDLYRLQLLLLLSIQSKSAAQSMGQNVNKYGHRKVQSAAHADADAYALKQGKSKMFRGSGTFEILLSSSSYSCWKRCSCSSNL